MARNVAIIGAGYIASAHVGALRARKDVTISAVVDPLRERADAMAASFGAKPFDSIEALLRDAQPDAAHVLTPPSTHFALTMPLLEAGVDTLLEKPMAETPDECRKLLNAATATNSALAVNHNFCFHPTFLRAQKILASGCYGTISAIQLRYAAPLRQMAARQFGHWMFNSPRNLLLEQAVHPLSQIDTLAGPIKSLTAMPGPTRRPADGIELITEWALSLDCDFAPVQAQIVLGASFPSWTMSILCEDGTIDADIFEGRVTTRRAHNAILPIDNFARNFKTATKAGVAAATGLAKFVGELSRLGGPSDGFTRSIRASVNSFHDALNSGDKPRSDIGVRLVTACGDAAKSVSISSPVPTPTPPSDAKYDVAILGGTGFIGSHLVEQLLDAGKRVAVVARNVKNLPSLFHRDGVDVFAASISDADAMADILGRSKQIVNLAHGGGGATREEIAANMIGGAETVARVAKDAGVERMIYVSSSAALYLGDPGVTITAASAPDTRPDERADYAAAKIECEHAMRAFRDLPIVIMRPAVVVGEGGGAFHSALGAYENETHCAGWNAGVNPMPFVLAEDVAAAIISALDAELITVRGKSFNLVGDVRWTARQYTEELANATRRPLKYHSSWPAMLTAEEWIKWVVKKIAGRQGVATPSMRDLKSRGMITPFDTSEEKRVLNWSPCADDTIFRERAIDIHVRLNQ